jgi:hypothetical protein
MGGTRRSTRPFAVAQTVAVIANNAKLIKK